MEVQNTGSTDVLVITQHFQFNISATNSSRTLLKIGNSSELLNLGETLHPFLIRACDARSRGKGENHVKITLVKKKKITSRFRKVAARGSRNCRFFCYAQLVNLEKE